MEPITILDIDDDVLSLGSRELLLQLLGYKMLHASDGESGLRVFQSAEIDLVILDYGLPDINGGVVARRMRDLKPDTPILMLSAHPVQPEGVDGLVDAYVTKNGDIVHLLKYVEALSAREKSIRDRRLSDLQALT
jgi:DNA-binding response OmpR family regulator